MLRPFLVLYYLFVTVHYASGSTWHGDVPSAASSTRRFGVMSQNQKRSVDVRGLVVMVNGSNRGIGRAILEGFLHHGASKAYAAVRSVSSVEDLVEQYGRDRVIPICLDVTDQSSIDEAAAIAQDVDVVVNNAGILDLIEPLGKQRRKFVASLQRQMDVNVLGLVRMSPAFLPILEKKSGGGAFVQINSTSSRAEKNSTSSSESAPKESSMLVLNVASMPFEDKLLLLLPSSVPAPRRFTKYAARPSTAKVAKIGKATLPVP